MFYVIEKPSQLPSKFGDCFIRFIPKNDNFHPTLTDLSLIYIRPLDDKKGYILCLDHTESFSLDKDELFGWLVNNTDRIWVIDKKEAMHWFPYPNKLFDAHLIEFVNLTEALGNNCIDYYYRHHINLSNINCLIPISKHYEECEKIFAATLPTIQKYTLTNTAFQINAVAVGKLAACCKAIGALFITVSTDYVFDGNGTSPYLPSDTTDPINYYGASKAEGEKLAVTNNSESSSVFCLNAL